LEDAAMVVLMALALLESGMAAKPGRLELANSAPLVGARWMYS